MTLCLFSKLKHACPKDLTWHSKNGWTDICSKTTLYHPYEMLTIFLLVGLISQEKSLYSYITNNIILKLALFVKTHLKLINSLKIQLDLRKNSFQKTYFPHIYSYYGVLSRGQTEGHKTVLN